MAKISIKKRLENEIKHIEDRLSNLNNSLKSIKNSKKEVESKYVDDIMASASLSTSLSTRIYEGKKYLYYSNRVEELSLKLLELKNKQKSIMEKEKYLDKIRATYYLLPLYNQIIGLKNVVTTVKGEIDKAEKELKKKEKQLSDKKQVKDAAENNYLKVSKDVTRNLDRLSYVHEEYLKTNEKVKELEALMKEKDLLISEISDKESEKLDLLFVLENSRVLKEKLTKEQDEIFISKEQIDNINKINDIEIEVNILENEKNEIDRRSSDNKKQMDSIKSDIDITKKKIEEIEELQRSLLPSIGETGDNLYTLISKTNDEVNRLAFLLSDIRGLTDERERLNSANELYIFELEELNRSIKTNKEAENKQKDIIKEIKNEIDEAKKEGNSPSVKKVIKELTSCIDKANKIINKSKEERFELKTKADEKNRILSINYAEIKLLNKKIDDFKKENGFKGNDDIVAKLETDLQRIKLLKSAIDDYYNYDIKKKDLEQDINENYALHHILSVHISELNTESENINFKIKSLREEYQDFVDAGMDVQELRNSLNENVVHSGELSKKIEGQAVLSLECNEKIGAIDSVITTKKLELASVEDRIEVLSQEISKASNEIEKISNGSVSDTKAKLNDKLNKATISKLTKDEEYSNLRDEYDALVVLINSKKALINKYNDQIVVFEDRLDENLKAHSIKSASELKSLALPKKEVDRIEKNIINYHNEVKEIAREKQVYLNMIAGKSLDAIQVKKDEEALKNVDAGIKKSINAYKTSVNKNAEAKYMLKNIEHIKEEIVVLTEILANLKETKKLLEKDN